MSNKAVMVDPTVSTAVPDGSPSRPFPTIASALAAASTDHFLASMDFPAPARLTVTLGLLASGELRLSLFWDGDRTHDIGTRHMVSWRDGRWRYRWSGHPEPMDGAQVLEELRGVLVRGDFSERSVRAFMESGVLQSVVRDVESHHLALLVMGS